MTALERMLASLNHEEPDRAAVWTLIDNSDLIVAQVNPFMPRVHGDGFLRMDDIDHAVFKEEPLLEFNPPHSSDVAEKIGTYCARIVEDGDTIQVGYGSIPNAIVKHLKTKKHLGIHTELIGDGLAELIRLGVIDNSRKTLNRGKTVGSFSMGQSSTYELLHDNPSIELRTVDYTNNPLVIARQENMVAINSTSPPLLSSIMLPLAAVTTTSPLRLAA